ncbi:TRAP transporter small permease subunit [Chloroflexota bacterium]
MKLLPKGASILDGIINICVFLAGAVFIYLMLSVFTEAVILRYFLGITTDWIREMATYTLVFITFLGTAWVLRNEGHVRMDLLVDRLKPKRQAMLNMITTALSAIACFIVTWYGMRIWWDDFQSGYYVPTPLETPYWYLIFVIPLGCLLLSIQLVRRFVGFLRIWRAS